MMIYEWEDGESWNKSNLIWYDHAGLIGEEVFHARDSAAHAVE